MRRDQFLLHPEDAAVGMTGSVQAGLVPLHPFFLFLFSSCLEDSLGCQCPHRILIPLKEPWGCYDICSPRSSSDMVILICLSSYKSVLQQRISL